MDRGVDFQMAGVSKVAGAFGVLDEETIDVKHI
jgi:hypothetical protein